MERSLSNSPTNPRDATGNLAALDDTDLIDACLGDDERAWAELVGRYERLVFSIPRRYGLDQATAEDIFQEVFAVLLRKLSGIRNRGGLPKWLITTTHRFCNQARKRRPALIAAEGDIPATAKPPAELVLEWEQRQIIRTALHRLGGRCEELLRLLYLEQSEPSYEQVARHLGMPVGGIGPTRARCLQKLLELLGGLERPGSHKAPRPNSS